MSRASEYTTPLSGIPDHTSTGIIKSIDKFGAHFPVGEISYERFDDQNFQYIISPYWNEIDLLPPDIFSGIPGINTNSRKEHYYRVNMTPAFIEMRTPGPGREDLRDLLSEVHLDYYDRFEWLLRTEKRCGDDNLIVVRKRSKRSFRFSADESCLNELQPGDEVSIKNLHSIPAKKEELPYMLFRLLSSGTVIYLEEERRVLNDFEKRAMLYLLKSLHLQSDNYAALRQAEGIRKAKLEGKYSGRKKQPVDPLLLEQVTRQFRKGNISEADAMKQLGISSRSTLYRRMREIKKY